LPPSRLAGLREKILADFRGWLDNLADAELVSMAERAPDAPDLMALFGELSAMRRDVQLQAKSSQGLRREVEELASGLTSGVAEQVRSLGDVVTDLRTRIPKARREAQVAFALELAEIREALNRCRQAQEGIRLPRLVLGTAHRQALLEELRKPLELVEARSADALRRLGVEPVAAEGAPFDAGCMRVVEAVTEAGVEAGTVLQVVRQGYRLEGEVIRTADVKVAR
jgi:molecular chaperone GrpE (heat shock protein)